MISVNDLKNGMVIKLNGQMYQILSFQHVKMQQRAPVTKTKMVNLKTGAAAEQSFRSGDTFEDVYLERREIQFLYKDGSLMHFMDTSDYHDVVLNEEMLGTQIKYLKDNAMATGMYCDGELLTIELPASVTLRVAETEPGIRGDTAKGGNKPATVETGAVVKVPLFINVDDVIKVDTRSGDYLERA